MVSVSFSQSGQERQSLWNSKTGAPSKRSVPKYVPGEIIIQYNSGVSDFQKAEIRNKIGAVQEELLVKQEWTDQVSEFAARRLPRKGDLELVTIGTSSDLFTAIEELKKDPAVEFAEPNWIYTHMATSNDPLYTNGSLWGMYGDATTPANQFGSQAGEAWARGNVGSRSIYVGVIDEGVQVTHPDLQPNVWVNPFDPVDGVDNDGNGYIDDTNGWDFANNNRTVYDGGSSGSQDRHGTHVAGTIGAVGGNGAGVAGVCWNVTIISGKFLSTSGGTTANAVRAIDYFTDLKTRHGLDIVATNNSWGGGGFSQSLFDAIQRANAANILFVAAAGNGGSDGVGDNNDTTPSYPASYSNSNIISVASITNTGARSSFSNFGATTVDLGAPGSGINSTYPFSRYAGLSGTSMATPHVSGGVALYAATHPTTRGAALKSVILSTTVPTPSLSGRCVTGGRLNVSSF
ncbi:MAG: S8 family serine peptidase [Blastocatellia bacterium]|nr:S8 family serine peptidase [Blastocatellia bacterium]